MSLRIRSIVGSAAVAGLVIAGTVAASATSAVEEQLVTWTEQENNEPLPVVDGLVFYKAAQINFGTALPGPNPAPFADVDAIATLSGIEGLSYQVSESSSWAPSLQLVIDAPGKDVTYARLTYEPYMQNPRGENTGEYTALEDGLWWANRVFVNGAGTSPFGTAEGSQSNPQPLSFFANHFGESAAVKAVSLHQGTSTESTSVVTSLTIAGQSIDLGDPDTTPFDQADIDAARDEVPEGYVAEGLLDDARTEVASLRDAVADANSEITGLEAEVADLKVKLAAAEKAAADAKAALAKDLASAVKAGNKASNRALKARAQLPYRITGKAQVGQTLRAKGKKFKNIDVQYQWRVGKQNAGKKATLRLKKRHAGKVVRLTVTKSYENAAGKMVSVKRTVRALKVDRVTR